MPPQIDKMNDNNEQDDQVFNQRTSVHTGRPASEQPLNKDHLQDDFCLTKFTFEAVQATRAYQSEWVLHCTETNSMKTAIEMGNLDNVKWIWGKTSTCWKDYDDVDEFFILAASKGHFEIMKWLHEVNCPEGTFYMGQGDEMNVFSTAAEFGSLEIMKWLNEKGYEMDMWTFPLASMHGNIQNMKWLKKKGCLWNHLTGETMVRCGDLENIIWAKKNGFTLFDEYTYVVAATTGNMKIMQWLKDNDIPMDEACFERAARKGNMEMMKWLKKNKCPWSRKTYQEAVGHGHRMLTWLKDGGCPSVSF